MRQSEIRWEAIGAITGVLALIVAIVVCLFGDALAFRLGQPTPSLTFLTDTPTPTVQPINSAQATQPATCQWLRNSFPQSLEEVRTKFNLPDSATSTFSLVTEVCPGVANGFIIRDTVTEFCLEVPLGGCIDSWSGDTRYEGDVGTPVQDGFGGWRVYKGVVCTRGMTYRVANCALQ